MKSAGNPARKTPIKKQEDRHVLVPIIGHEEKKEPVSLRSFTNLSKVLSWVIDADEKLVFASRSFNEYFQLGDESVNSHVPGMLPIKVINGLYEKHIQVLNTGHSLETFQQVKLADGSDITFLVYLFPVVGEDNKRMIGGEAVRLPDKYNTEKQLRGINEHLLRLSDTATDAVWEWDMQTGHIFRNDALLKMIGYTTNENTGLAWWFKRMHPQDRNRVSDKIKEITDKGLLSWEDEYRFKCANGEYKLIRDHGYVVYENGLPIKMIGSLHDMSEVKNLQNELNAEQLERQKELSETVIRVQENERTKIGYELHDNINQILSTAKLFVDLIKPADNDQQLVKEKSAAYMKMAIEEIRKLSKELVAPQLKEKNLVTGIRKLLDDIYLTSGIQVTFRYDDNVDDLSSGKKVTLFRVVQEQMKNIFTHSQATKAAIHLSRTADMIALLIEDNGVGFDSSQTRRGIGLSNIYERTRFYNGTVTIETATGRGCVLSIMLPVG